ncbi:MAG: hypothetical protein K6L75_05250 [Cellvibrionaceae bacterium]
MALVLIPDYTANISEFDYQLFNASHYLKKQQNVATVLNNSNNGNALKYFITWGKNEVANPTPLFDEDYYLDANEQSLRPFKEYNLKTNINISLNKVSINRKNQMPFLILNAIELNTPKQQRSVHFAITSASEQNQITTPGQTSMRNGI